MLQLLLAGLTDQDQSRGESRGSNEADKQGANRILLWIKCLGTRTEHETCRERNSARSVETSLFPTIYECGTIGLLPARGQYLIDYRDHPRKSEV